MGIALQVWDHSHQIREGCPPSESLPPVTPTAVNSQCHRSCNNDTAYGLGHEETKDEEGNSLSFSEHYQFTFPFLKPKLEKFFVTLSSSVWCLILGLGLPGFQGREEWSTNDKLIANLVELKLNFVLFNSPTTVTFSLQVTVSYILLRFYGCSYWMIQRQICLVHPTLKQEDKF